jgi:hypothetical protein
VENPGVCEEPWRQSCITYYWGPELSYWSYTCTTGYVRDRDQEFISKGVERKDLVAQLEELIPMINETVNALSQERMEAEYPLIFDNMKTSNSYVLLQLLLHLNYHLGQVNYLRRIFE